METEETTVEIVPTNTSSKIKDALIKEAIGAVVSIVVIGGGKFLVTKGVQAYKTRKAAKAAQDTTEQ